MALLHARSDLGPWEEEGSGGGAFPIRAVPGVGHV